MYNNSIQQDTYQVSRVSSVMKRVYANMTLAMVVTAFTAMFCANSEAFKMFMQQNSWAMWGLVIAEFAVVIGISAGLRKLSTAGAFMLFMLFSVLNGMMLTPIFLAYTHTSLAKTFFITAGTFGAMSIYGFFTNRDLTRWGNLLFMALIGLIIASVVNIFLPSQGFSFIISIFGVLIFVGLTAWDTQAIKMMAMQMPEAGVGRLAVLGALNLYLDFINLFLFLLRFFGNGRD